MTSVRGSVPEFDWTDIRRRLAETSIDVSLVGPGAVRQLMDDRARRLAQPLETRETADLVELVTFALAAERYGVETRYVREVVRLVDFALIPGAPAFLLGITAVRGENLPIVDLRKLFDVPSRGLTDLSRLIVLGTSRADFGVLADQTFDVGTIRLDQIDVPTADMAGPGRRYLRGVTRDALIVLDGEMLLRDPRLFVDQGSDHRPHGETDVTASTQARHEQREEL